jgi:hypothetical protein
MNIYYVYFYLREDFTPYYVGKGKGKRAYSHHSNVKRPKIKSNIIIVSDNLSEIQSFILERYYIKWFGRKINNSGILHNKTEGGEGTSGFKKDPWNKGKKTGQIPWNKGKNGIYSKEVLKKLSEKGGHAKGKLWYNDGIKDYHIFPEQSLPNFIEGRIFKRRELEIKICPYCGLSGSGGNMTRYHFNNCNKKGENRNSLPV